jgi:glucuronokinase
MRQFAALTDAACAALAAGDWDELGRLIDRNFDLRRELCPDLPPAHVAMVDRARALGVSAHFCGSGGAILGICRDDATLPRLRAALGEEYEVIRPIVAWHAPPAM